MDDKDKFEILIYGVGAIGAAIGGLLNLHYDKLYLLARGENVKILKSKGLTLYQKVNKISKKLEIFNLFYALISFW